MPEFQPCCSISKMVHPWLMLSYLKWVELDVATVATYKIYNLHVEFHYSVLHISIYLITKSRWFGWTTLILWSDRVEGWRVANIEVCTWSRSCLPLLMLSWYFTNGNQDGNDKLEACCIKIGGNKVELSIFLEPSLTSRTHQLPQLN